MYYFLSLIVLCCCTVLKASLEDHASYYASLDTELRGQRLQIALHAIIAEEKTILTGKVANEVLKLLYETTDDQDMISLFYSGEICRKDDNLAWNVEHIWPQKHLISTKRMNSDFDLFNMRPTDRFINAERATLPFGDGNGEPSDLVVYDPELSSYRGEIARALFYMATRYGFNNKSFTRLKLTNNPTRRGEMGLLQDLLRWNAEYPVSDAERYLNDQVYLLYQYNRNPFIDDRTLADKIWGNDIDESNNLYKPDIELFFNAFSRGIPFKFRRFGYMKHPNRKQTKNINVHAKEPHDRQERERNWKGNGCEMRYKGRKVRCWPPARCIFDELSNTCVGK